VTVDGEVLSNDETGKFTLSAVFRPKALRAAREVTIDLVDANLVRDCSILSANGQFRVLVDGICEKVVRKREPRILQSVYPNPASTSAIAELNISADHSDGRNIALVIKGADGGIVMDRGDTFYPPGIHPVSLRLETLPNGTYWIEMRSGEKLETKRLVITR
jgi:hypothetical protein